MHANWLLDPPVVRLRGFFFQRLFLHPPTPATKNLAKWKMQCIHWGLSLFHNVRGLPWLDQGPEKQQHGWVQGTIWVQLVPKFAQMCNIIHPLVINNQEYNFMTSNDSPSVTMTGFYVYWECFFCVPW